jgi:hypothetical protein
MHNLPPPTSRALTPAGHGAGGAERWRRSSSCAATGCLEVAFGPGTVSVRDSKRADSPVLTYDHQEWQAFIDGVRRGEFNLG